MGEYGQAHLAVLAKMVREPVVGKHHKQRQTIIKWCGQYDGSTIDAAIDDLVKDPSSPVYEKGRGTITLRDLHEAKEMIEEHDEEGEFSWFI